MKTKLTPAIAAILLSGCATNGGPLVFGVTRIVGVDIQTASSSSVTPGLTVGYKSVDLAIVPTQRRNDGGDPLKGCYAVALNGATIPAICNSAGVTPASPSKDNASSALWRSDGRFVPVIAAPPPPPPPAPNVAGVPPMAEVPFAESVVDAYSVYATFKGNVKGSGSGSAVDLGEVFATGDAAVQLAEGVNYYSSRAGNAKIVEAYAQSTCVAQLTAAKTAGVDMSKVPACPEATPASNPAPTLSSISPTSGTGPAAGTAAIKVPVTLVGTGLNSASKLTVAGNAGVTADQLAASGDGKTITATLTIAPGAAKAACTIAVTNPPPGGGTSGTVAFSVN